MLVGKASTDSHGGLYPPWPLSVVGTGKYCYRAEGGGGPRTLHGLLLDLHELNLSQMRPPHSLPVAVLLYLAQSRLQLPAHWQE